GEGGDVQRLRVGAVHRVPHPEHSPVRLLGRTAHRPIPPDPTAFVTRPRLARPSRGLGPPRTEDLRVAPLGSGHARSRSPLGVTRNPASVSTSASAEPSEPTPSARSTASVP